MSLSSDSAILAPPPPSGDADKLFDGHREAAREIDDVDGVCGKKRFIIASILGAAVAAVPFLWILWGTWQSPSFFRKTVYQDNFYDLQTRAMFHGHLWLAKGSLGIEAFVHGGREYTYFGLFPSILRMPILAVTSNLDGRLTAPFILAAWLLTAVMTALLFWRVRILIRGSAALGAGEAWSYGLLMATILGGSTLLLIASNTYVFNEDISWSVGLTIGGIFAMLGVLERPTWGRVALTLFFVLACNLDRANTGWASVGAAVLIGIWFGWDRHRAGLRRWCLPMLAAGLVPLIIGCAVNYAKFKVFFGVSNYDQVWTHVNAYRRKFLASNHNAEEGTTFIPSDVLAYLRPDGIRFTSAFPFITLPSGPAPALSGVLFDRRYRTASVPASMPLLFLLTIWGLITAFRPKPIGKVALTRVLFLAAGAAAAALFLWGYIAPRYLGDFMPLLVLGSAVAVVDIWRRMESRSRRVKSVTVGCVAVLAIYSMVANIGMAITPNEEWNTHRVLAFVEAQHSVSSLTGESLSGNLHFGSALPPWAPADQLFVIDACAGLYISNGEDVSTVPAQQLARRTWQTVELGHQFMRTFEVTAANPISDTTESVSLVTVGPANVALSATRASSAGSVRLMPKFYGGVSNVDGQSVTVRAGSRHVFVVITDPATRFISVTMDGTLRLEANVLLAGAIYAPRGTFESPGTPAAISATNITAATPGPSLCRSLVSKA